MESLLDGKEQVARQNKFSRKNRALAETYTVLWARNHKIIIQSTLNEQKLQTLKLPGRTDAKLCAYAAWWWWPIHCSQSCNDLTLFAVGSMCAEKENPKAGRSLQSFSLRLNVVQKPATTSLEMKHICCSSWACTCRRFICTLKDSFYWREEYP